MQIPAESVLQCKRQFARSSQISEFHIFAPPNAAPCTVPPGAHAPLRPPPAATVSTPKIVTDTALQSGQGFLAHPAEHNIGPLYPTQICVQLPMSAVNVTLLAFAAERRAAARAAVPLLLGARRLPRPAPPLSIDISRRHGAQQQTRRTPRLPSHDDIQTNGRTVVS